MLRVEPLAGRRESPDHRRRERFSQFSRWILGGKIVRVGVKLGLRCSRFGHGAGRPSGGAPPCLWELRSGQPVGLIPVMYWDKRHPRCCSSCRRQDVGRRRGVGVEAQVAAAFGPFVMLFGQRRAHQTLSGGPVGEDAHLPYRDRLWWASETTSSTPLRSLELSERRKASQ